MEDGTKAAVLSAIRSILIAVGSMLAAKGYIDDGTVQSMIGAVMVIIPVLWGVLDKYQT
ncbi:MAG: Pam3-gp28 family putative phage holin, partial [Rhodanobacter sp.]